MALGRLSLHIYTRRIVLLELKSIIVANGTDFSPEGVSSFLRNFSSTVPDAQRRVGAFVAAPRDIITHAFELTSSQRKLLIDTTDDELALSLEPVFTALRRGQTLQAVSIQTVARGSVVKEPVVPEQQQAQNQIVITIGKGRCKITITIDL